MGLSLWQIILVIVLAILLFGRGRISDLMGDVAKGIKSFKSGMAEDDNTEKLGENKTEQPPKSLDQDNGNDVQK
ncbi:MAG: twin-arginine translocase TatA/TatE family subunit [Kordiimonas sp.]|nr:twin-arginine translocase TatA/TatE family subunit [Kordiimonas sp.]|tara:strand:- start:2843 stop:3064 length:222 start_codon:yes stop_codon:yes gene_type:complete